MPNVFDSKYFNSEVFAQYMETVPKVKQNALLKAGVLRTRNDIKALLPDQVGGNYVTVPMTGLLGGTPDNYDGSANITTSTLGSYYQSMIVYGRAHGWTEKDFTADITGTDFLAEAAKQIAGYWDDVQQGVILSILKGIFAMTSTKGGTFAAQHTFTTKALTAATLNKAVTKACGANRGIMRVVVMNSADASVLEAMNLLDHAKYTDAQGVQKDIALATWNGREVLLDDDIPVGTMYVMGEGLFDYCDVGAKVPYETHRDPKTNGGLDELITRERKLIAPRGISFVQPSTPIVSPTNAQFEGANWQLVKASDGATWYDHKAIPVCKIVIDAGASNPDEA